MSDLAPDQMSAEPPPPCPALPELTEEEATLAVKAGEAIQFDKLKAALDLAPPLLPPEATPVAVPAGTHSGVLEELAEDMLELIRRLQNVEQAQTQAAAQLTQLDARTLEMGRAIAREMDAQRRDLLGERKGLLARSLFNALVAHIDSLRAMRAGLEESKSKDRHDKNAKRVLRQLEAIDLSLVTALQGLGFREFHATVGDPFSPATMECLGYAVGQTGIVLKSVRPGFLAPDGVARPVGVLIADPTKGNVRR